MHGLPNAYVVMLGLAESPATRRVETVAWSAEDAVTQAMVQERIGKYHDGHLGCPSHWAVLSVAPLTRPSAEEAYDGP